MDKKIIPTIALSIVLCLGCIYFAKEKITGLLESRNVEQTAPDESEAAGTKEENAGENENNYKGWVKDGVEHEPEPEISDEQVVEIGTAIEGGDALHAASSLEYRLKDYFFVQHLEQLEKIEGYQETADILRAFDENGNYNPQHFGTLICVEYEVTNLEDHTEVYSPHIMRSVNGWRNGRVGDYITGSSALRLEDADAEVDEVTFQAGETKTFHELGYIFVPDIYADDTTAELLITPVCSSNWNINSSTRFYHLPLSDKQRQTIWDNSKCYEEYLRNRSL